MRRPVIRRLRHWIANRGLLGTAREGWARALRWTHKLDSPAVPPPPPRIVPKQRGVVRRHPFDVRFGTQTNGAVMGEQLEGDSPSLYWAPGYHGIAPSVFGEVMTRLALDWSRYTFVDIGCGKGRAVMLAMQFGFRAVTGCELSPSLAAVAQENLRIFAALQNPAMPCSIVEQDALEFELPTGPLVLFLFHPFAGPVMRRFLLRLRRALDHEPREVWLVYVHPELEALLRAQAWLEMAWEAVLPLSVEDNVNDWFNTETERVIVYRVRGSRSDVARPADLRGKSRKGRGQDAASAFAVCGRGHPNHDPVAQEDFRGRGVPLGSLPYEVHGTFFERQGLS